MTTSPITSSGMASYQSSATSSAAKNAAMGKQDFLKLLVAQLQHQDPLQPMENTEFVAQLAQFSSLEQQISTNDNLSLLQIGQSAMTNSQVAGLIGKEVEAKGGVVQLTKPGPASLNFSLPSPAKDVSIKIMDSRGNLIRTIKMSNKSSGLNAVTWDGKDSMGNAMSAGTYTLEMKATDAKGNAINVSSKFKGTVTGVSYENGVPILEVGSAKVRVGDVIAVRGAAALTTTTKTK